MENTTLLPAIIPKYRIKEHNPEYDCFFGKGKGWIYCTNYISDFAFTMVLCSFLNRFKNGMKHSIEIII